MTLYFIGLGLSDEKDISVKGLEAVKQCSSIYLESYTSRLLVPTSKLEEFYEKKIIEADRELVEKKAEETILRDAEQGDTAFLVIGDVFGATTHTDLYLRAQEKKIPCKVIHNTSIINAVADTGLELYKFGKTTSIPYPSENFKPTTAYDVLETNSEKGMHTLMLLDIKKDEERFMTVNEAIQIMLDIEQEKGKKLFTEETVCIGCARLGSDDMMIKVGTAKELKEFDFGGPLHCMIVPRKLHFIEEDMLKLYK
jgi:diphthine synthase